MDFVKFLKDPLRLIPALSSRGFFRWLPDKPYLQLNYYAHMGRKLDLKQPRTYTEKLQWLKLYDRDPRYPMLVDKLAVRRYIAQTVGQAYLVPLLGAWDRAEDVDFDSLPRQFVLKCTHDSGGVLLCPDKEQLDRQQAIQKLRKWMNRNYYWKNREWPYRSVKPRILAEAYLQEDGQPLRDYKFFCFDGAAKLMFVVTDRQSSKETKFDFFDMDYRHLPVCSGHPNSQIPPEKPGQFSKMRHLAQQLSQDFPHLRVDFYEVGGKVYVGELTLYHWGGMVPFDPPHYDAEFGQWLSLPEQIQNK